MRRSTLLLVLFVVSAEGVSFKNSYTSWSHVIGSLDYHPVPTKVTNRHVMFNMDICASSVIRLTPLQTNITHPPLIFTYNLPSPGRVSGVDNLVIVGDVILARNTSDVVMEACGVTRNANLSLTFNVTGANNTWTSRVCVINLLEKSTSQEDVMYQLCVGEWAGLNDLAFRTEVASIGRDVTWIFYEISNSAPINVTSVADTVSWRPEYFTPVDDLQASDFTTSGGGLAFTFSVRACGNAALLLSNSRVDTGTANVTFYLNEMLRYNATPENGFMVDSLKLPSTGYLINTLVTELTCQSYTDAGFTGTNVESTNRANLLANRGLSEGNDKLFAQISDFQLDIQAVFVASIGDHSSFKINVDRYMEDDVTTLYNITKVTEDFEHYHANLLSSVSEDYGLRMDCVTSLGVIIRSPAAVHLALSAGHHEMVVLTLDGHTDSTDCCYSSLFRYPNGQQVNLTQSKVLHNDSYQEIWLYWGSNATTNSSYVRVAMWDSWSVVSHEATLCMDDLFRPDDVLVANVWYDNGTELQAEWIFRVPVNHTNEQNQCSEVPDADNLCGGPEISTVPLTTDMSTTVLATTEAPSSESVTDPTTTVTAMLTTSQDTLTSPPTTMTSQETLNSTGAPIFCDPPKILQYSSHEPMTSSYPEGSILTYTCDIHHSFSDGSTSRSVICQPNGVWSTVLPDCIRKSCGAIDTPHSTFTTTLAANSVGVKGSLTCDEGQVLSDGLTAHQVQCTSNGEWYPGDNTCSDRRCGPLPYTPHATPASYTTDVTNDVIVQCDVGYRLDDGTTVFTYTCGDDLAWLSSASSLCNVMRCPPVPVVSDAGASTDQATYGTVAEYTCNEGFYVPQEVPSVSITCMEDGNWSEPLPYCREIICSNLTTPHHGFYTPLALLNRYKTLVNLTCTQGYRLDDGTHSTVFECRETGSWSQTAAYTCEANRCSPPPSPDNTQGGLLNVSNGAPYVYKCVSGYELENTSSDSVTLTCMEGAWVGPVMACTVTYCAAPLLNNTRSLEASFYPYDTRLTVSCDVGHTFDDGNSTANATCLNNHIWSLTQSCQPVVCPPLPSFPRASVSTDVTVYPTEVIVICHYGYWFYRDVYYRTVTCTEYGIWSEDLGNAPCEPAECLTVPLWNGVLANTSDTSPGTIINYTCTDGFQLGDQSPWKISSCSMLGVWEPLLEECTDPTKKTYVTFPPEEAAGSTTVGSLAGAVLATVLFIIILMDLPTYHRDTQRTYQYLKKKWTMHDAKKGIETRAFRAEPAATGESTGIVQESFDSAQTPSTKPVMSYLAVPLALYDESPAFVMTSPDSGWDVSASPSRTESRATSDTTASRLSIQLPGTPDHVDDITGSVTSLQNKHPAMPLKFPLPPSSSVIYDDATTLGHIKPPFYANEDRLNASPRETDTDPEKAARNARHDERNARRDVPLTLAAVNTEEKLSQDL